MDIDDGDALLGVLGALASPHRLRILAALAAGETHVSQLARDLGIGRPLVHMHLARLQRAGLVQGRHEVSGDGRSMRIVQATDFTLTLDPARIAALAPSITDQPASGRDRGDK